MKYDVYTNRNLGIWLFVSIQHIKLKIEIQKTLDATEI